MRSRTCLAPRHVGAKRPLHEQAPPARVHSFAHCSPFQTCPSRFVVASMINCQCVRAWCSAAGRRRGAKTRVLQRSRRARFPAPSLLPPTLALSIHVPSSVSWYSPHQGAWLGIKVPPCCARHRCHKQRTIASIGGAHQPCVRRSHLQTGCSLKLALKELHCSLTTPSSDGVRSGCPPCPCGIQEPAAGTAAATAGGGQRGQDRGGAQPAQPACGRPSPAGWRAASAASAR